MSLKKILIETITQSEFTSYLKRKREEFINDGVCSYYEINNGYCGEFADEIENELGGDVVTVLATDMFQPIDEYIKHTWVKDYNDEILKYGDVEWSKKMLDIHGYPDNYFLDKSMPNHLFLMFNNKYFDAEEVNGVNSPWKLPIFKRKQNWV